MIALAVAVRADNAWTFPQPCPSAALQQYLISQGFAVDYIQSGPSVCIVQLSDGETKDPTQAVADFDVSQSTPTP